MVKTDNRVPRRWASRDETAEYLRIGVRTLDRWVAAGRVRAYRGPGGWMIRFDLNEVDDCWFTPIASPMD